MRRASSLRPGKNGPQNQGAPVHVSGTGIVDQQVSGAGVVDQQVAPAWEVLSRVAQRQHAAHAEKTLTCTHQAFGRADAAQEGARLEQQVLSAWQRVVKMREEASAAIAEAAAATEAVVAAREAVQVRRWWGNGRGCTCGDVQSSWSRRGCTQ